MINRNLCTGMLINGVLSHYTPEEVAKDKHLEYIGATLRKKHFPIKNGTPKQRLNKDIKTLARLATEWTLHAKVSDAAWRTTSESFPSTNEVTTTDLIVFLLEKNPSAIKYYGFNKKRLESFKKSSPFIGKYGFRSLRVVNAMYENLDKEIEKCNS